MKALLNLKPVEFWDSTNVLSVNGKFLGKKDSISLIPSYLIKKKTKYEIIYIFHTYKSLYKI